MTDQPSPSETERKCECGHKFAAHLRAAREGRRRCFVVECACRDFVPAPVSVPEERQDDRSLAKLNAMCEAVATVDDLVQARKLLSALCNGEFKRWRMCVPVQRDDSDMVLSRVILTAGRYVKLQSSLDALAVAVKQRETDQSGTRDDLWAALRLEWPALADAITALLSSRETTNA